MDSKVQASKEYWANQVSEAAVAVSRQECIGRCIFHTQCQFSSFLGGVCHLGNFQQAPTNFNVSASGDLDFYGKLADKLINFISPEISTISSRVFSVSQRISFIYLFSGGNILSSYVLPKTFSLLSWRWYDYTFRNFSPISTATVCGIHCLLTGPPADKK